MPVEIEVEEVRVTASQANNRVQSRFLKGRGRQRSICTSAACAERFHEDRWSMEEAGWDSKLYMRFFG